jgi:catechol 2,3-dioxygenase-like lactoylglutathione lyase family enzyme
MSIAPRVSLATLGVRDLDRSTAFYLALGWPLSPASVPGEVSFFPTAGALLALYGHDALARDAGLPAGAVAPSFRGAALAINLEARAEVDRAFEQVRRAGGEVVRPPAPTPWGGYVGYFHDPDGHLWEVAHNPSWPIGPDGRPQMPPAT